MVVLLGLAAAWRWTPLAAWLEVDTLVDRAAQLGDSPIAPLVVLAAYVVGGLVMVPVTLFIVATAFAFGPLLGFFYSLLGCLLSAALTYGVGYALGREGVRYLAGSRLGSLSRRVARHGLVAVVTVRVLPIAPFTVVNIIAGASRVRFRDFALGTVLGMAPGILAITLFERQLENAIRDPGVGSFALLAGLLALIVLAMAWVRRRLTSQGGVAASPPQDKGGERPHTRG